MKITGCRVNYGASAKKELFELLPRSIERMITSNSGQSFDFKIELTIGGRVTSAIKSFGPDFEGQSDFEILKGQILPVVGNRRVVSFGLKFNEDGTIDVVSAEEIPSNEGALPRESTVKQLEKIRKATKSTTIDDRVPKMKGANLGYERNVVDKGIESYEDFQKKNKSFIPSQNLKHLKKFNEGLSDLSLIEMVSAWMIYNNYKRYGLEAMLKNMGNNLKDWMANFIEWATTSYGTPVSKEVTEYEFKRLLDKFKDEKK